MSDSEGPLFPNARSGKAHTQEPDIAAASDVVGAIQPEAGENQALPELNTVHPARQSSRKNPIRKNLERAAELERVNEDLRKEISIRKEAEAFLERERRFIESIIQTAQVILIVLDLKGNILLINPYLEEISGYNLSEVRGKSWPKLFLQGQDMEILSALFSDALQGKVSRGLVHPIVTRDGRELLIEWNSQPLKDPAGQLLGLLAIGEDVTEKQQAQEKILNAARRAQALAHVAERINAQLDLQTVLNTVCEETLKAIPSFTGCSVMLYSEAQDAFQIAAAAGAQSNAWMQTPPIPREVFLRYAQDFGSPIVIPDLLATPHLFNRDRIESLKVRSVVSVQMASNEETIGVLNVTTTGSIHVPEADELSMVRALADQATIAIANARLFERVAASQASLAELSKKLIETQEIEKRNLARELHDEIGQMLTSLHYLLDSAARSLEKRQAAKSEIMDEIHQAQQITVELLEQVRELSLSLRPALLDDLGLLPALVSNFDRYTSLTGIVVNFKHHGIEQRLPSQVETAAFRIVQESLTNVARHAHCRQVNVRIWADAQALRLQVEDHGAGFDVREALEQRKSDGLTGMRERAALCGGFLEIESVRGAGTCITAEMPLTEI